MKRTVYVVQQAFKDGKPYDLTPALEYGSLEFLLDPKQRFYGGDQVREISDKLYRFTEHDYLLAMGDPAAIGVACAVAAARAGGKYTMLVWKGAQQRYFPVDVNVQYIFR